MLGQWLKERAAYRTDLADGTKDINRWCGRYLRRFFGSQALLRSITRGGARKWRTALSNGKLSRKNKRHKEPPGEQTLCKLSRAAKQIFDDAVTEKLIADNPFAHLPQRPAEVKSRWSYVDRATMEKILDACPDRQWRCFFSLLRFAGLRRGEALGLMWQDVRFDAKVNKLLINIAGRQDTKHQARAVPIELARSPTGLIEILQRAFTEAPAGELYVCRGLAGGPGNVNTRGAKIVSAAGVPTYRKIFQTLRRNCESDWALRYPQHAVSDWIGHSIEVSEEHYLQVEDDLFAPPPPKDGQSSGPKIGPNSNADARPQPIE